MASPVWVSGWEPAVCAWCLVCTEFIDSLWAELISVSKNLVCPSTYLSFPLKFDHSFHVGPVAIITNDFLVFVIL